MEKITSSTEFICFEDIHGKRQIINKQFVFQAMPYYHNENQSLIILCYPGMRRTDVIADCSIEELWRWL